MRSAKLYVGNLSYETSETTIRTAFEAHGEVTSVNLITDRDSGPPKGFGLVEMGSTEEAEKAKSALDGTELDGRADPAVLDEDPLFQSGETHLCFQQESLGELIIGPAFEKVGGTNRVKLTARLQIVRRIPPANSLACLTPALTRGPFSPVTSTHRC